MLAYFLSAIFHGPVESSSADLIFAPYMETTAKLSDSMSLSQMSENAESTEGNVARYYFVILSCCSVCV